MINKQYQSFQNRSVHLKIASVTTVADDPTKILINSGTTEIIVKAASISDKNIWLNALREA